MSEYNFYRDGGSGECRVSVASPYMPSTMRQLATTVITEHDPIAEVNAIVERPQNWLDDTPIEVVTASINEELHMLLRREEDKAFATGTRSDEPQGVFTSTSYQRVTEQLSSEALISFVYKLSVRYRIKASWMTHPDTLHILKRMTDGDGRFIYQQPPCHGVPGSLLGWPLWEDVEAQHQSLAFGDFSEAYQIASAPDTVITRDPFSKKPMVLFHARRAVNGAPRVSEALKVFRYDPER